MKRYIPGFLFLQILLWPCFAFAQNAAKIDNSEEMRAMKDELARIMEKPELFEEVPPYFIAYTILDVTHLRIEASFGALETSEKEKKRHIKAEIRVGDISFDQSNFVTLQQDAHFLRMESFDYLSIATPFVVNVAPFDGGYDTLRYMLWLTTENSYQQAKKDFKQKEKIRPNLEESALPSFSSALPEKYNIERDTIPIETMVWENAIREYSSVFQDFPELYKDKISFSFYIIDRFYHNSEGSEVIDSRVLLQVSISAETRAQDDTLLKDELLIYATSREKLPKPELIKNKITNFAKNLTTLKEAPILEDPYQGPVLFEEEAAGQIVAKAFTNALSSTPIPRTDSAFAGPIYNVPSLSPYIGKKVLPEFLSLEADPTLSTFNGEPLLGTYQIDDEGVSAQKVQLVEKGILKTLLASRTPSKTNASSNGHGRSSLLQDTRGRVSNLILTSQTPEENLEAKAIEAAKEDGLSYVLVVKKLQGNAIPNYLEFDEQLDLIYPSIDVTGENPLATPFKTYPVTYAYKLYPDGKREMIRNLTLSGVDLTSLQNTLAVGDKPFVYHTLDASLGNFSFTHLAFQLQGDSNLLSYVPQSIVTPSFLLKEVKITKRELLQTSLLLAVMTPEIEKTPWDYKTYTAFGFLLFLIGTGFAFLFWCLRRKS